MTFRKVVSPLTYIYHGDSINMYIFFKYPKSFITCTYIYTPFTILSYYVPYHTYTGNVLFILMTHKSTHKTSRRQ